MKLPLVKGTRIDVDAEWRDTLPRNMVGFYQSIGSWSGYLRTADGLRAFATGFGADRGGIWSERFRQHYRLSGDTFVKVDEFGDVTDLSGGISVPGSNQARFANSFNSVAFVANGEYYRYDGTTFAQIARPLGSNPFIDMCWIDGYYIFTDGENLYNTLLADETSFGGNERAGSDFAPDEIIGIEKSTDNKLLAFNRYTTERFYNNAGPAFPFARIPNAALPIGIVGTDAKVSIGDGQWVIFGGSKEYSPSFYLMTNSYSNISTKEIDSIIDGYSDFELTNIKLEYRDTRDQGLVICHLPRDVLVFDVTLSGKLQENIWYRWDSNGESYRAINGVYDPRNISDEASSWIYGDKQDGTIGRLDETVCTQYDEAVEWECQSPLVRVGSTVKVAELVTAPGHSTVKDDVVYFSTTKDGALFGSPVLAPRGAQGDYQHRIIIRRLGDYPRWMGVKLRGFSKGVFSVTGVEINEVN
ncbi:MAG TPA: packaged DNA stabilization protein [Candidatus Obscuribacterales bacterium]